MGKKRKITDEKDAQHVPAEKREVNITFSKKRSSQTQINCRK